MPKPIFVFAILLAAVVVTSERASADPLHSDDYKAAIEAARAKRETRLKAPDGWLSLIGLPWLKEGRNTVGSARDNDVVLSKGPAHLGVVNLSGGKLVIDLDRKSAATIDGIRKQSAELLDDSHDKPTTVAFDTVSFYAIDRSGRKGLRVKDTAADARTHFLGIDYFPIDPGWRVEAKYQPFEPSHSIEIPTVIGTVDKMTVPGKVTFERDGKTFELLPVLEDPKAEQLWFIFADRTSGKESYGAGRFLYAEMPKDGKLTIDFNNAYNPPCAFTPHATCPLAPPENRLDLPVTAGERKYRGGHH